VDGSYQVSVNQQLKLGDLQKQWLSLNSYLTIKIFLNNSLMILNLIINGLSKYRMFLTSTKNFLSNLWVNKVLGLSLTQAINAKKDLNFLQLQQD